MTESLIAFAILLVLVGLRVPIAFAMGIVGFAGFALVIGPAPSMAMVVNVPDGQFRAPGGSLR